MINLTLVTACMRPYNLTLMQESINPIPDNINLIWLIVFDTSKVEPGPQEILDLPYVKYSVCPNTTASVGGVQKNHALTLIEGDPWVYFLDDDTIMHPNFYSILSKVPEDKRGVLMGMNRSKTGASPLIAGQIAAGHIDTGCFILKRSLIGKTKLYDKTLCTEDFYLIRDCWSKDHRSFITINEEGSYFNQISGRAR